MSPTSRTAPRQRRAGDERRPVGTAGGVVTPRARHTTRALLSAGSIIRAFPRGSPSDRPTDTRMFPTTSAPRPLARVRGASVPAGVESFDVNLETQKVMVKGTVTQQQVIDVIAKTGKAVEPGGD